MYGHQFYQSPISKRIEYLNKELSSGCQLEDIAVDMFIDVEDIKEELRVAGYFYVKDLNRFVWIEVENVG